MVNLKFNLSKIEMNVNYFYWKDCWSNLLFSYFYSREILLFGFKIIKENSWS